MKLHYSSSLLKPAHPLITLFLLPLLTVLAACNSGGSSNGDDTQNAGNGGNTAPQQILTHTAQKGPFSIGSLVTLTRIDEDGNTTSDELTTTTEADGSFDSPELSWDGPTMVTVTGPYFDEIQGTFTTDELTLRAFPKAVDGQVDTNVNLLTHILARYIEYWMAEGDDYDEARDNDGIPYLSGFFGISVPPGELNLLDTVDNEEIDDSSRMLLLLSAAFLDAGLDQEALDTIADDFAESVGEITGDGRTDFQNWMTSLYSDTYNLYSQAHSALQQQYSRTEETEPEASFNYISASNCKYVNILCGEYTNLEDLTVPDSGLTIPLWPETTGIYRVSISYNNKLSWQIRDADTDAVVFPKTGGYFLRRFGANNAAIAVLRASKRYVLVIRNQSESVAETGIEATLGIVSYGRAGEPVVISKYDDVRIDHAGINIIPADHDSTQSFYRIKELSGSYSLTLKSLTCNFTGELGFVVTVFQWGIQEALTPGRNPFEMGSVRAQTPMEDLDACQSTLDFTVEDGFAGYISVKNRKSTLTNYSPDYDRYRLEWN